MAIDAESLRELSEWRPPLGVVSVYADIDPADRGGGWRISLRNGLRDAVEEAGRGGHDRDVAARSTGRRIEEWADGVTEAPRGIALFAEISENGGEERLLTTNAGSPRAGVFHGARPWLAPLVEMAEAGSPAGVAVLSAERIRLLDWRQGHVEELENWILELNLDDWRERKAQRPPDPAGGQSVSSSGRDQHDQRMTANRERFVADAGKLARDAASARDWRELIVFGDSRYAGRFIDGVGDQLSVRHADDADLVSLPDSELASRLSSLMPALRAERERALVAKLDEFVFAEGRATLSRTETMQALEQGRVDHLLYVAGLDTAETEQMLELAIATAAKITPIADEQARTALEPHDGVAAILRF